MSVSYISATLPPQVEKRASYCCEYCLLPTKVSFFSHEIDHIIPEKHDGKTEIDNLAYTCWRCNRYKGTDLGSFDPQTGSFSFLFNPRIQKWSEHFKLDRSLIIGLTSEGRTTVKLLQLNNDDRLVDRKKIN